MMHRWCINNFRVLPVGLFSQFPGLKAKMPEAQSNFFRLGVVTVESRGPLPFRLGKWLTLLVDFSIPSSIFCISCDCFCMLLFMGFKIKSLSYYMLNVRLEVGMPESQCIGCKRKSASRLLEDEDAEDTLGGTVSTSCGLQFASPPVTMEKHPCIWWVGREDVTPFAQELQFQRW